MGTLSSLINSLKSAHTRLKAGAEKALYKNDSLLLNELIAHSPIDTGNYSKNWKVKRLRFGTSKTLAGLTITNDTAGYGQFIESGAPKGKAPWYYPQSKKTGRFRKSEKLTVSSGRVWAGGLNPGHDKTIGGAISIVMGKRGLLDKITIDVSNEIVKGFL